MYAEITTALTTIKTVTELTGLILKSKVDEAVRQKAIELQSLILSLQETVLSVQSKNHELLEENNALKQKLMNMKNWKAEARKYKLTEIASGVFAYAINQDKQGTEPKHWLCANCYENQQKSILQKGKLTYDGQIYSCGHCKLEILDCIQTRWSGFA